MRGRRSRLCSLVLAVTILSGLLAGCSGESPGDKSGALQVAAAFYPIELVARRVGGDLVEVTNVTPPGGEPHDLELKPSDVRRIKNADLILYFAKGFQPAVDGAVAQLSDRTKAVDLLAGISLKAPPPGEEEELTVDPHVWLDPTLMQRMVDMVTEALVKHLPSKRSELRSRATALKSELTALDGEFTSKLVSCARHEIFTSHAAFAYLADRYGLKQVAITGLSPEAEPSSKRLQEIARKAREAKATTIFFETLISPRVSQAVARIIGAKTAVLDPIEGVEPDAAAKGADYFSIMRQNLAHLIEALGCTM